MRKVELLIPAGNLENLKIAIAYGTDAVFIFAHNTDMEEVKEYLLELGRLKPDALLG